jgi:hypothetical protein
MIEIMKIGLRSYFSFETHAFPLGYFALLISFDGVFCSFASLCYGMFEMSIEPLPTFSENGSEPAAKTTDRDAITEMVAHHVKQG